MSLFYTIICWQLSEHPLTANFPRHPVSVNASDAFLLSSVWQALSMTLLPALLYKQFQTGNWLLLGVGISMFLLGLDHFMLRDTGSVWQTFVGVEILFGFLYLPPTLCIAFNRWLGRAIAGPAPVALTHAAMGVVAALALAAQLIFFLVIQTSGLLDTVTLVRFNSFINGLFHMQWPVDLLHYRTVLNMLCALFPTMLWLTIVHAWLRRRRTQGVQAVPWQLRYVAALGTAYSVFLFALEALR